ncbi:MAG TPA: hypothetical protein DCS93_40970 [Microscillaceae bacterium]|nr:hypothetical protein [Microscillaceae bacterium]
MTYEEIQEQIGQENLKQVFEFLDNLQSDFPIQAHAAYQQMKDNYMAKQNTTQLKAFVEEYREVLNDAIFNKWVSLGYHHDNSQQYNEAIKAYKQALTIKPENYEIWNTLGSVYFDLDNFDAAKQAYRKALEIKPDFHVTWLNLGGIDNKQGDLSGAIRLYQKAIHFKPDYEEAWYNLGVMYSQQGQLYEAIDAYKKAVEFKPDHVKAWYNLALVYHDLDQKEGALQAYQQTIALDQNHYEAWHNLGFLYGDMGKSEEAIKAYEKALEANPQDRLPILGIGWTYFTQEQWAQAKSYFEQVPHIPNALMSLGHIAMIEADQEQALKFYQQSFAIFENKGEFFTDMEQDYRYLEAQGIQRPAFDQILTQFHTA